MFAVSLKSVAIAALCLSSSVSTLPIKREVPQEHSHEPILTAVRASLQLSNPNGIADPVFGLLGNAAAAGGAGKISDVDCLQQATADQAFTNSKKAGDVQGQVNALIYRALERNTGKVGQTSNACKSIKAVNPEIAAIQQHQDPASTNAAAVNKAITLELAKQIKAVGGDPQDALKSGTFAPGNLNDNTGKGNTCDDANNKDGCIFTENLLVPDATAEEIDAAVGGASSNNTSNNDSSQTNTSGSATATSCPAPVTVTVTVSAAAATSTSSSSGNSNNSGKGGNSGNSSPSAGNVQTFTGALGGASAPAVTPGGRGFVVDGQSDSFLNKAAALGRSCDVQHNKCANIANSAAGRSAGVTVSQCDQQNNQCRALIQ